MAVAKIFPNSPINYGGSAILTAPANTYFYVNPARSISIPDGSGLALYIDQNGKYLTEGFLQVGGILAGSGDTSLPVASGDAVVYYAAAGPGQHHVIQGIGWGYDGVPTGGSVSIESPSGVPIFGPLPVTAAGASFEDFPKGLKAHVNKDLLLRVKAGGGSVKGVVSAKGHRVE